MVRNKLQIIFALIFPVLVISFFFSKIGFSDFVTTLSSAKGLPIFFAYVLFLVTNICKTVRFRLLLGKVIVNFSKLYFLIALYNFITTFFPGGLGEASYPWLLKRNNVSNVGVGITSVVMTRMYDCIFLSIVLLVSTLQLFSFVSAGQSIFVFFAFLIICIVFLLFFDKIILIFDKIVCALVSGTRFCSVYNDISFVDDILASVVSSKSMKVHFWFFLTTFVVWVLALSFYKLTFYAFSAPLGFVHVMFVTAVLNLISVVPLNTIGGIGVKEATLSGVLIYFGLPPKEAISLAMAVQVATLPANFVLLGWSILYLNIARTFFVKKNSIA